MKRRAAYMKTAVTPFSAQRLEEKCEPQQCSEESEGKRSFLFTAILIWIEF